MMRFIWIALLTVSAFASGSITPGSSCGKGDKSRCGWQAVDSNPYAAEGGGKDTFQTGATTIAACDGGTLTASTKYYFTADDTTNAKTAVCKRLSTGTQVDLNGHHIQGYFDSVSSNVSGEVVFNGWIDCDTTGLTGNGCAKIVMGSATLTAQVRLHHLKLTQNHVNVDTLAIPSDQSTTTTNSTGQTYSFKYDHLSIFGWQCNSGCSRNPGINWVGNSAATLEWSDSYITANANQFAGQGIQQAGSASNLWLHNHYFDMPDNATAESDRSIAFNANSIANVGAGDISLATDNYFFAQDNRVIRIRSRAAQIYRSIIDSPNTTVEGYGQIHFYDQQQNFSEDYTGCLIKDTRVISPVGGNLFYGISGTGCRIEGTTVVGTIAGGKLLQLSAHDGVVNKAITNISCAAGLATYTATGHGMCSGGCSASNQYSYKATVTGTTGNLFNLSANTLTGIPDVNSFTYNFGSCPAASDTTGTLNTNANTSVTIINNGTIANPNFTTTKSTNSTATTNYCNSGTADGASTGTNTLSCP
jgi:hypothetical protein